MRLTLFFVLSALATISTSEPEVFDLGELDQYKPKQQDRPTLNGNSLWLSGTESNGGFDIGISPDVKAKLQGVLEGCGQLDDKCYHEAREIMRSVNVEVDHKLERRAFRDLLTKTVKGAILIFADIAISLRMTWFLKSKDQEGAESFMFIPVAKASEAAKFETATELVVSAESSAIVTIKPTPAPTTVTGSHNPSITAVTSPHDGLSQGDIVVSLDPDLASRMQEIMMRSTDCDEGAKFDREHSGPVKRRANSRLGRAICAYQAVIVNIGGTLSDLIHTDFGGLDFTIPTMNPERAAAAEFTQELIEDYAPIINLQIDRIRVLGAYLFALTIGVVMEDSTLGASNKIPSTLIATGAPTIKPTQTTASPSSSSSSSCPDPTQTPLFCGRENEKENNCEVNMPKTKAGEPKCAEKGDYPDCPCNLPTDMTVQYVSETEMKAVKIFTELFRTVTLPNPQTTIEVPKGPTKALGIVYDMLLRPQSEHDLSMYARAYWHFFATDYGKTVDCRDDPVRKDVREIDPSIDVQWYPGGEFSLDLFGENCTYKNAGDNAGKLFCGEKSIDCFWDPPEADPAFQGQKHKNRYDCFGNWQRQTVFTCPF
ncbi:hypothetical protein BKA63DRAFT_510777 [Paraphoma chrysanthemicola]|nr:hypothetical protein BKA63DRAFT_510777 [Paraphoma chrysanthemicola]